MSPIFKGLALGATVVLMAGSLRAETQDEAIHRLQEKFIAPCCWAESVAVHRSEAAAGMRVEIARLYKQGVSEQEITQRYVSQYGERILMVPSGSKFTWLIVIPVTVTLVAGFALMVFLRRRAHAEPAAEPARLATVPDEEIDW
ncbi:cytochrome c-type biogenesis protein [Paludibaculum fermentans]|uniref:Cytochrome c-type biogenesis protein n=1 Tax=Paludibaculum fermentans TaxID=1473598 RepID=A0A7S7NN47_PALFE|nr:cytochrome c-type biogenesis protein CcmH [Paludibaculum fermentans]QOY86599.1 cytochrome c-type biogenesis protein CcmH [Paludibaculum fermentans]